MFTIKQHFKRGQIDLKNCFLGLSDPFYSAVLLSKTLILLIKAVNFGLDLLHDARICPRWGKDQIFSKFSEFLHGIPQFTRFYPLFELYLII